MEPIELLEQVLGRKTCLVGIGNSLRSDDGLGPYLIESLRAGLPEGKVDLLVVDDVPENFTSTPYRGKPIAENVHLRGRRR